MANMGAMLKFPIAVNCTCLEVFCAVAAAGVTVMLWSCREGVEVILLPPHAARQRKRGEIKKEAKRNFISASQKAVIHQRQCSPAGTTTPAPYSSPKNARGVPALDCLPSNDMAVNKNKMSAGVKRQ